MKQLTIAIAEDSDFLRGELISIFNSKGINVVAAAANGKLLLEALAALEELPQLCLTDIRMPEMNGYETVKELKRLYPSIRVVAFSTNKDRYTIEAILKAGADRFIWKGCTIEEYMEVFHQLV
jgi:two-component system, NarL family, invasion response regulator UvrY